MSPLFVMPPSASSLMPAFFAPALATCRAVSCGMPTPADRARALADLDGVGAARTEILHAAAGGDVAGDEGEILERTAHQLHDLADAGGVSVRRGYGDAVDVLRDEVAHVFDDPVAVQRAVGLADGREGGADHKTELGVAGRFPVRLRLGVDALHIGGRDEPAQLVVIVDDEHLVDANISGEKRVRGLDRILGDGALLFGDELGAGRHHVGHQLRFVAILDHIAGEQAGELPVFVDHWKGGEREPLRLDHGEQVADELAGGDGDRILDQAVDVPFHAGDFLHLIAPGHVVMDEPEAAVERHRDRHARLGYGVHVRRNHRNLQPQRFTQRSRGVSVLGQDVRIKRGERDVVERECGRDVGPEKRIGRQIKVGIRCRGGGRGNLGHELP